MIAVGRNILVAGVKLFTYSCKILVELLHTLSVSGIRTECLVSVGAVAGSCSKIVRSVTVCADWSLRSRYVTAGARLGIDVRGVVCANASMSAVGVGCICSPAVPGCLYKHPRIVFTDSAVFIFIPSVASARSRACRGSSQLVLVGGNALAFFISADSALSVHPAVLGSGGILFKYPLTVGVPLGVCKIVSILITANGAYIIYVSTADTIWINDIFLICMIAELTYRLSTCGASARSLAATVIHNLVRASRLSENNKKRTGRGEGYCQCQNERQKQYFKSAFFHSTSKQFFVIYYTVFCAYSQ